MKKSSVGKNTFIVGAFTSLSRVLGLIREMMQSRLIGAGVEQSAFTLAFALPNMARKLFGEGALTAAFVPVFRGEVELGNIEQARKLANAVVTMVMTILGSVVVLTVAALSAYLNFAVIESERLKLTLEIVRILFPYMIFICGAAFGMGVLNALGRFKAASFMPSLLNVIWIAALGVLCFFPGMSLALRVKFVALAILFGGLAQMVFLFREMAKRGFAPKLSFVHFREENFKKVCRNTIIAAVGAGAIQINYMLDQVLAQYAAPWAASVIGYAERLMDLPLGVIGVAFGTVLLPTFAGLFARSDFEGARKALSSSLVNLMLVMLPAAAGLCVLSSDVTAVIYEGGQFDGAATLRVSRALAVYAVGLGFFGYQKSIVPWFQAQNDMKTPLRVSVAAVVVNAALNVLAVVYLPQEFRHVGLAASTVICALFSCALLTILARKKNGSLRLSSSFYRVGKILCASVLMAAVIVLVKSRLQISSPLTRLMILIPFGMLVYAVAAFILLGREIFDFRLRKSN